MAKPKPLRPGAVGRQRARIEAALKANPKRSNGSVAEKLGLNDPSAVRRIRKRLEAQGVIKSIAPSQRVSKTGSKPGEKSARIEAMLKADPTRTDAAIGEKLGAQAKGFVWRIRRRLEHQGAIPSVSPSERRGSPRWLTAKQRARIGATLKATPTGSNRSFAEKLGVSEYIVASVRRELEANGLVKMTTMAGNLRKVDVTADKVKALHHKVNRLEQKISDLVAAAPKSKSPCASITVDSHRAELVAPRLRRTRGSPYSRRARCTARCGPGGAA